MLTTNRSLRQRLASVARRRLENLIVELRLRCASLCTWDSEKQPPHALGFDGEVAVASRALALIARRANDREAARRACRQLVEAAQVLTEAPDIVHPLRHEILRTRTTLRRRFDLAA